MNDFDCQQCGDCCKNIRIFTVIESSKIEIMTLPSNCVQQEDFPYHIKNGQCEKLTDDNKCSVYSNRPILCDVKKLWQHRYSEVLNWEDFYRINKAMCPKS